ncbi:hypothetical protein Tco_0331353 [Tanacetum coccineum]
MVGDVRTLIMEEAHATKYSVCPGVRFSVGDHVMMKVSPWKGVVRFDKKGELAPRYIGPFEILERIGPVAFRLRLPDELSIGSYLSGERISKKRTKNEAKTTKPDTEWKSRKKTKSKSKPKCRKVNPDKPEAKKSRKTSLGTKLVKSLNLFKEEKEEKKEKGPFCQFGKVKPQGAKLPIEKILTPQGRVVQLQS